MAYVINMYLRILTIENANMYSHAKRTEQILEGSGISVVPPERPRSGRLILQSKPQQEVTRTRRGSEEVVESEDSASEYTEEEGTTGGDEEIDEGEKSLDKSVEIEEIEEESAEKSVEEIEESADKSTEVSFDINNVLAIYATSGAY